MGIPSDYVVWLHHRAPNACRVERTRGPDVFHNLFLGEFLLERWPNNAELGMRGALREKNLSDSLFNTSSLLMISDRLRAFLEESGVPDAEYLPVRLRHHKSRLGKEPYFVVNFTHLVDLFDADASNAEGMEPDLWFLEVDGIVLKEGAKKVAADRPMFRLQNFPIPTLVTRKLAARIDAAGFTGIRWGELADFQSHIF